MWCRKRLDVGWKDLCRGLWWTLRPPPFDTAVRNAESALLADRGAVATLSVRSGFDALLQELNYQPGTEILLSAVTVPGMAEIVREHGLIPVPVDVLPTTMFPTVRLLREQISPKTKAIVVAQLFGAIHDLKDIAAFAREHHLLLIEDCAQAFDGPRYKGHDQADVAMFSFGPIKTSTALSGALLRIRDPNLRSQLRNTFESWPIQPLHEFRHRILKYMILKFVSYRFSFALLWRCLKLLGRDPDQTLNRAVRNFPGDNFFPMLRRRPCPALLNLVGHRIRSFDLARQDRRTQLGAQLQQSINQAMKGRHEPQLDLSCPGAEATRHSWWIFPLAIPDPETRETVIADLERRGFDATAGSQLKPVLPAVDQKHSAPANAISVLKTLIHLPVCPEMTEADVSEMADTIIATHARCTQGNRGQTKEPDARN